MRGTFGGFSTPNTRVLTSRSTTSQGGSMSASTAIVLRQSALPVPLAGSLDAYIQSVSRIPVMDVTEEQRLARSLREDEDLGAAKTLVISNLRFVVHIARGYMGYGLQLADLIQEGNV